MVDLDFDVVALPEADHPTPGDEAPDFTRPLVGREYWADTSLSELADEGAVLVVFHPMDGAFPATYMWQELDELDHGATTVGVSISSPYEHRTFVDDRDLDARLFSDPANDVAKTYGVAHDLHGMAGVSEPRPAVFLVDGDLQVEYAWAASEWPEFPDYDAVEREAGRVAE